MFIQSTVEYFIQHELLDVVNEFRNDVDDVVIHHPRTISREELLSEEQHLELAEALQNDHLYSSPVARIIKNTKLRQDRADIEVEVRSGIDIP